MTNASTSLTRELATAVIEEACGDRPTLIAQLVGAAFAARLVDVHRGREFLYLSQWVDQTCERYGTFPSIAQLLTICCSVSAQTLHRRGLDTDRLAGDLNALAADLRTKLTALAQDNAFEEQPLSDGVDEAIAAFLVRLDETDPLSAEHSRAVALWCRRLARRLVLPDGQCLFVMRGGMLHDVGKTSTPREILLAPRALTDAEFATMRDHSTAGAAMVMAVERLQPFAALVRGHHERLDGKGYPDRLSAAEISLNLRIVAVADCFNAMIGRRPYRPPMTPANALEQLVRHSGTQFDPYVVEAMRDILEHPDQ